MKTKTQKMKNNFESYMPKPVELKYKMRLFIAGNEVNSQLAQKNLIGICESGDLKGNCDLEIVDVFQDFDIAIAENILVTPALLIDQPKKMKIFGNLQDKEKVLSALATI